MNSALRSRLVNWKFGQAMGHIDQESQQVRVIVEALARTFGDCGWFDGDMGIILERLVGYLTEEETL